MIPRIGATNILIIISRIVEYRKKPSAASVTIIAVIDINGKHTKYK